MSITSIDSERAYEITERLAFPRLVGSEGEKKAIEIIVDELRKTGYESIHREKFKTSFYNWLVIRIVFVPFGLLLILTAFTFFDWPGYSMFLSIFCLIILFKSLGISDVSEIKLRKNEEKNFETENIFVELKSKNSKANVIFMGHWDTKSQTFPVIVRMIIFIIAVLGDIIIIFTYLILSLIRLYIYFNFPLLFEIFFWISIVLAITGALNFFNKTGNESPGAKDNATAIGTVIELARFFRENPLNNIDSTFLLTSSEELNLGGAKDFIQKHKNEFEGKPSFFINLDTVGGHGMIRILTAHGIPKKTSSEKLNALFLTSAKELNVEIKGIYIPTGAWGDHMPIIKQGFEACMLGSLGGLKEMHTSKDDMTMVSKEGLKNCLLLCFKVAKKLNDEFS